MGKNDTRRSGKGNPGDAQRVDAFSSQRLEKDSRVVQSAVRRLAVEINRANEKRLPKREEAIQSVCMLSREVVADYIGAWLWNERHLLEQFAEVESNLGLAINFVRNTNKTAIPNHLSERVKKYLGNEAKRKKRADKLNVGVSSFLDELEKQRTDGGENAFDEKIRSRWSRTPKSMEGFLALPRSYPEALEFGCSRFLIELKNFGLEIDFEAGPYVASAVRQAKLAKRILDRNRAWLRHFDKVLTPIPFLSVSARSIFADFEQEIVLRLQEQGGKKSQATEANAQRTFQEARVSIRRIEERVHELYGQCLDWDDTGLGDQRRTKLAELLGALDTTNDAAQIGEAFDLVASAGLSPAIGILPDSPALQLLHRLLEIAPNEFIKRFGDLITPGSRHFRKGFFQVALVNLAARHFHNEEAPASFKKVLNAQLAAQLKRAPEQSGYEIGSLGALTAGWLLVQSATSESWRRLETVFSQITANVEPAKQPLFFETFVGTLFNQPQAQMDPRYHRKVADALERVPKGALRPAQTGI